MPRKNWAVGVKKNIILAGPIPIKLNPFVYQNKGTKVIMPAHIKYDDNWMLLMEKIFKLFITKYENKIIAIGVIINVSIKRPMSEDTFIFFLINPYKLNVIATINPIHGMLFRWYSM